MTVSPLTEAYVERGLEYLAPLMVPRVEALLAALHAEGLDEFQVYETYRSPLRQRALARRGNSKVLAYGSAHQFGLAIDVVRRSPSRGWTWDVPGKTWTTIHNLARKCRLVAPIQWDPYHLEAPEWRQLRTLWLDLEEKAREPSLQELPVSGSPTEDRRMDE